MKQFIITAISLFLFCSVYSQNETSNWYFGNYAGLKFLPDTVILQPVSAMQAYESCSSVSDSEGNLLFYTNGAYVWNRFHQLMQGGQLVMFYKAYTQIIIVKQPENDSIYYIFNTSGQIGEAFYSKVNMNADNGKGAVISKYNQIIPVTTEKVAAVKHFNGTDYWVVYHNFHSDEFYAFLLTSGGLQTNPVISKTGTNILHSYDKPGQMKISPPGNKIACAWPYSNSFEIYDFDTNTGNVANAISLNNYDGAYGLEFSSNGRYLYGTCKNTDSIYQFDTFADDVPVSVKSISAQGSSPGQLQLASDKKIYASLEGSHFVGAIENPNEEMPVFNIQGAFLGLKTCYLGLPSFPADFFYDRLNIRFENRCFKDTTFFNFTAPGDITQVEWNFNYPSPELQYQSNLLNPEFSYSSSGNYTVRLIGHYSDGNIDTVFRNCRIFDLPQTDLTAYEIICANIAVDAGPGFNEYLWNTGETTQSIYAVSPGLYTVTLTDERGCMNTDSINILNVYPVPEMTYIPQNVSITGTSDGSIDLSVSGGTAPYNYLWSNGETTEDLNNIPAGCYEINLSDQNNCSVSENICITGPQRCDSLWLWVKYNLSDPGYEGFYKNRVWATETKDGFVYAIGRLSEMNYLDAEPVIFDDDTLASSSYNYNDMYIAKFTSEGECLWIKFVKEGTLMPSDIQDAEVDSEGNIIITGLFVLTAYIGAYTLYTTNFCAVFTAKFNSDGDCLWAKQSGGSKTAYSHGVSADNQGNVYVAGVFNDGTISFEGQTLTSYGGTDGFLVKYSPDGECLWVKHIGGYDFDGSYAVCNDSEGSIYVSGSFRGYNINFGTPLSTNGESDAYIVKYDTDGNFIWVRQAGCVNSASIMELKTDKDNNLYAYGFYSGNISFGQESLSQGQSGNTFIAKYNSDGELLKAANTIGYHNSLQYFEIRKPKMNVNSKNEVFILNRMTTIVIGNDTLSGYFLLAKHNKDLDYISVETNGDYIAYDFAFDQDDNMVIGGYGRWFGLGDYFVYKGGSVIAKYREAFTIKDIAFSGSECNHDSTCIDISISNAVTPVSYMWSTGETTEDICGVTLGDYNVTVMDATDCYIDSTITVSLPEEMIINSQITQVSIPGGSDGTVDISVQGGTSPYQYLWSNGETTEDITNLSQGTYTVTVTDSYGCSVVSSVYVTQPDTPIDLQFALQMDCNSSSNGSIDMTITGGTSPYQIQWSSGETTEDISNLSSGWYSVLVFDGTYYGYDSVYISTESIIIPEHDFVNTCQGFNNGSIDLSVTGGTQPLNFEWSNTATSEDIQNLSVGQYSVIITDAMNCLAYDTVTISEDMIPDAAGNIFGDETELCIPVSGYNNQYGTGIIQYATNYIWTLNPPEAGTISGTGTQAFADWIHGYDGVVSISVSGENHCGTGTASPLYDITVHSAPTSVISGDTTICKGENTDITIEFTGTSPWSLTYTDGINSFDTITSINPFLLNVSQEGIYQISQLSDFYCSADYIQGQAIVSFNPDTASIQSVVLCNDTTYTAPDGNIYTETGIYEAVLTNSAGCDSTVTIDLYIADPIFDMGEDINYCNGDTVTINAPENYEAYTWNGFNGDSSFVIPYFNLADATVEKTWEGNLSIPDNGCGSNEAEAPIFVEDVGTVKFVEVHNMTIMHNIVSDLRIWLTSPSGTEVFLAYHNGNYGDNYINTSFSDTATLTLYQSYSPYTGTFIPNQSLSAFIGEDINGEWKLVSCDDGWPVTGTLVSWSLYVEYEKEEEFISGVLPVTVTDSYGCIKTDSIIVTENLPSNSELNIDLCDETSYTAPDGNIYSESGIYTAVIPNTAGCDSTITVDLSMNYSTEGTDIISACDSYTWIDGNTYFEDNNTATYTLANAQGCDSLVTLDLTVITIDNSITVDQNTLTATMNGATYQWVYCNYNYAYVAGATEQSFTATQNGTYAVIISQNGCVDTSECVPVTIIGVEENSLEKEIQVIPNPSTGIFTVNFAKVPNIGKVDASIIVTDITGKTITNKQYSIINNQFKIDLSDKANGVYFLHIRTGNKTAVVKLLKE